ncbi:hypothetical protein, partial [Photorhabdus sp. RM157S]|uniref:hypothetical protein n=1 Tax=Photorhabdus sp. RM157S TaxID=3342827 RepID=UPI0036DD792A
VWTPPPRGRPSSLAQHCTLYLPQGAFVAHLRRNPRKFCHSDFTLQTSEVIITILFRRSLSCPTNECFPTTCANVVMYNCLLH